LKSPKLTLFRDRDDPYLEDKRIELDSIIQKVGSESFWKYVVHKLETEFPAPRDYREIVPEPKPEDYYPEKIKKFLEYIEKSTIQAYASKLEEIKESELSLDCLATTNTSSFGLSISAISLISCKSSLLVISVVNG